MDEKILIDQRALQIVHMFKVSYKILKKLLNIIQYLQMS